MNEITHTPPAFVNRIDEVRLAEQRFEELLSRKKTFKPVLFFYGVPLVGKTTLLKEMVRRAAKRGIPTAEINFSARMKSNGHKWQQANGTYAGDTGKVELAFEVLRQLERTADAPAFSLVDRAMDQPEQAAAKVVLQISRLHRGAYNKPVALFFDTLEDTDRETFTWLQEQILKPALDEGELFVAMAARAHFRALGLTVIYPVIRHMEIHPLRPFGQAETRIQFQSLGQDMAEDEDFTYYTGGIPGINEKIILEKYYRETASLTEKVVNDVIFEHIAKRVEAVQDVLLVMAAFRWFGDRLLAHIAHHFWPEKYEESRRAGNLLARKLLSTMLVEERLDESGYVVASELRSVLDRYQWQEHPEQHLETHVLAFRWFEKEVRAGDWDSLVDQVYHLVAVWHDLDRQEKPMPPEEIPYPGKEERLETLKGLLRRGLQNLPAEYREKINFERISQEIETGEEFSFFEDVANVHALGDFLKNYPLRENDPAKKDNSGREG